MKARFILFFILLNHGGFAQIQLDSLLFACYPLNSNSGDSSANNYHGIVYGAVPAADRFNNANSCYFFDGQNDYIDIGNVLNVPAQSAITFCMWMYPMQINGPINRNVGMHVGEKAKGHLALRMQTESVHYFQALLTSAYSANSRWTRSNVPYTDNNWYFLVGVYTNNYVKLYVDGVQQTTNTGGAGPSNPTLSVVPSTEDLKFARLPVWNSPASEHFFHGKLDDIRIYTRELNQSEITYLYQNQVSCSTPVVDPCNITAGFNVSNVCLGNAMNFQNTSIDINNSVLIYNWDFGDGNTSTMTNPSHLYSNSGSYNVKLIVRDSADQSCADSITIGIEVLDPPTAYFNSDVVCFGDMSSLTDASQSSSPIVFWEWRYGKNGYSNSQNISHNFSKPGNHSVSLVVANDAAHLCKDSTNSLVTVNNFPLADFTFEDNCIDVGTQFTDLSNDSVHTINSWLWNFGDSNLSNLQNPTHVFNSVDSFEVTLTIENDAEPSCSVSESKYVHIYDTPMADLGPDLTECKGRDVLLQVEKGQGNYTWDDSSSSHSRVINNEGIYWIQIENSCGISSDTISVKEELCFCKLYYPNSFTPNDDDKNDVFKVESKCEMIDFEIVIFNRWGDPIFTSDKIDFEWDGTFEGEKVQFGVYPFRLYGQYIEDGESHYIEDIGTIRLLK